MSALAANKPAEAKLSRPGQYEVARAVGRCAICGELLAPGAKIMVCLRETPTALERSDFSLQCWPQADRTNLLAFWQTTVPHHEAKKKVFVDDEVLCELFERLKDTAESAKLNFRFVLGLILMRKRLLVYESSRDEAGRDIWTMRFKGKEERMDLLNPRLDEQQVTEVSQQLGEILNQEL